MSSSTTKTIGVVTASGHPQGRAERREQRRFAERLEQAVHRPLLEQAGAHGVVRLPGDEHYGHCLTATHELALELGPRHARHGDVEDQALRPVEISGGK